MIDTLLESPAPGSVPLIPLVKDDLAAWLDARPGAPARWVRGAGFDAEPGSVCLAPGTGGELGAVLLGVVAEEDPWCLGGLAATLPEGDYHLEAGWPPARRERAALGWALGAYRFTRYKAPGRAPARLAPGPACDPGAVRNQVQAITLVRDLINTPAAHMMPEQLGEAMAELARRHGGEVEQVVGETLLARDYPAIHAVGRASAHAPRLLDLHWGQADHPRITLVGKGVCFDSGGLDLKPASGMRLMKKDMGGAAHAIGLAHLIMAAALPVRLRVLVPAVENAVSGNALRPGDVIATRQGLTVEIENTDAEGRLVLADALAEAARDRPALMMDFATLTGAARVALGTDVPALFSNAEPEAAGLLAAAREVGDPLWRLPLHAPYRELLDSRVADIANASSQPYGGAITAALFLQSFVPAELPWVHLDLMAWNLRGRPGRPEGGEAMGLRAVFAYLERRLVSAGD